jgi:4-aminobutyrate aminotransferase/(S)-3-amino-2-methylpropionate transaminase
MAGRLNALVGDGYKSILLTTGAEAVENAVKIARAYTNRPAVVAFRGGFHGRTLLGMTLTGMSVPYQQNFGPFAPAVFHVPYPYAYRDVSMEDALRGLEELFATELTPDRVAAILIEPVQGDGGFLPAPAPFLRALREITQRHGIMLILDEIQTGFGRTGTMFGFQRAGIEPDLITVAKSLAGGLPLSAVIGRAEMMDAPLPGGLGGTYGGNALACAAALGVLDAFQQDGLLEQGRAMGAALEAGLRELQQRFPATIGEVRGVGPMLAIEMVGAEAEPDAALTQRVIDEARAGGLLVIKCGVRRNVIRFLAPLVTTLAQVDEALEILGSALESAGAA